MSWNYAYTSYIWPMVATAAFMAALALYGWRHRSVPGALPFAVLNLCGMPLVLGAALGVMAAEAPDKIFWFKFVRVWLLASASAEFWFALEYANLRRWITRRTLTLLAIPPLLLLLLAVTNDAHHWLWLDFPIDGRVRMVRGIAGWALAGYGALLSWISTAIFVGLLVRSPQRRVPVAIILCGQLAVRAAYVLDTAGAYSAAAVDLTVLACGFLAGMYALALFRFRLFSLIPVARGTVIEQMQEGMLVVDTRQRVVDLNPAAERILGVPAARARGASAVELLPACRALGGRIGGAEAGGPEIMLEAGTAARHYAVHVSSLTDPSGHLLGSVILLHDMTEEKRAQAQVLEQQRVMATLEERQRLAREVHDSVGQVLGYVSMQAQAIGKWVHGGEVATAEAQLLRLAQVAQDAHDDIRESIANLRVPSGPARQWSFLAALRQHVDGVREHYGVAAELAIPPGFGEDTFEPDVAVQLLRVIQEATTNARRHGRAGRVRVAFELGHGEARIIVADDGRGFDPDRLAGAGTHCGLTFMRERAAHVGGCLTIESGPDAGTRVVLKVPIDGERGRTSDERVARG